MHLAAGKLLDLRPPTAATARDFALRLCRRCDGPLGALRAVDELPGMNGNVRAHVRAELQALRRLAGCWWRGPA